MLKFFHRRGAQLSADRAKLRNDLYSFRKSLSHGFPHHPSALALEPRLGLLAIGTKHGLIRVYGKAGVEFHAQLDSEASIRQIQFIECRAQLIVLGDDSSIHLFEINNKSNSSSDGDEVLEMVLELASTCYYFAKEQKEGNLKQITTITVSGNQEILLVGTLGGNIYMVNLDKFDLSDQIIYQDVVLQNIPEDQRKSNPGEVELIAEQPGSSEKFLIGYNRGLMVLWDNLTLSADRYYGVNQQLEGVSWEKSGEQFMSAHNDGSYIVWKASESGEMDEGPKTPYGPFPCKPMNKIIWRKVKDGDDFIIFSGGMPRASYGDKNTVSIIQGCPDNGKHHVLDLTSKLVDFSLLDDPDTGESSALFILAEEELVAVDLLHPDWLQFKLPYLSSLHSSPIITCQHLKGISEVVYSKISAAGGCQSEGRYSGRAWPISGGQILKEVKTSSHDLLITGHEDSTVRFWSAGGIALEHLYTLQASRYFQSPDEDIALIDEDNEDEGGGEIKVLEEDEWPPFRKVGTFDPYSDDPRLAIRKIQFCPLTGTLAIAGTAGQVIILNLREEAQEKSLNMELVRILEEKDGFVWKGHDRLHLKNGNIKMEPGFQPSSMIQLMPPASVTALALHSDWGLVAAGTAHGFVLFDYIQSKSVLAKSTLNPGEMAGAGDGAIISRRKSFKKSLRESFRRLRMGRGGGSPAAKKSDKARAPSPSSSSSPSKDESSSKATSPVKETALDRRPIERQVEARGNEDGMSSLVRCLCFARAYMTNNTVQTPTLWAGTNAGTVQVYTISLPEEEKRHEEALNCQLGKEIHLKHAAPVLFIQVIDASGYPLPEPGDVKSGRARAPSSVGTYRVLICSEEQFKLFTLPGLKPISKFKLTAHEGAKARRINLVDFISKTDEKITEHCFAVISNLGEISVHTCGDLKRQLLSSLTKKEDIDGISSTVFFKDGQGFYLQSPGELRRFSMSAKIFLDASCGVKIEEDARPKKKEQPKPVELPAVSLEESKEEGKERKDKEEEGKEKEKEEAKSDEEKEQIIVDREGQQESPSSGIGDEILKSEEKEEKGKDLNSIGNAVNGDREDEDEGVGAVMRNGELEMNGDTSRLTNDTLASGDITIDSVRDHMTNLNKAENSAEVSEVKKKVTITTTTTTVGGDGTEELTPIINSHED